jgi:hypothetical protein
MHGVGGVPVLKNAFSTVFRHPTHPLRPFAVLKNAFSGLISLTRSDVFALIWRVLDWHHGLMTSTAHDSYPTRYVPLRVFIPSALADRVTLARSRAIHARLAWSPDQVVAAALLAATDELESVLAQTPRETTDD